MFKTEAFLGFRPTENQFLAMRVAYFPAKDSAAFAANVFDFLWLAETIFISCQSYGNSLPQPRQATYVPVICAAGESR